MHDAEAHADVRLVTPNVGEPRWAGCRFLPSPGRRLGVLRHDQGRAIAWVLTSRDCFVDFYCGQKLALTKSVMPLW